MCLRVQRKYCKMHFTGINFGPQHFDIRGVSYAVITKM